MAEETTNTQKIIDTEVLGEKIVEELKTINEDCDVKILMTLTSPNCPVADALPMEVKEKVQSIDEVHETIVELTFDPPWHQDMMSEVAKLELGFL